MRTRTKRAGAPRRRLPLTGAGLPGTGTGMGSAPAWLSFRRIVDIPFDACVAALESWRLHGHDTELHVGQSRVRGPIEHDPSPGTCRIEVRLARGPLRPALRMRLNLDCWSTAPPRSVLELIPDGRVRATARYFQAGHLLLDSLTRSLQLERQIQAPSLPAGQPSDPARAPQGPPAYLSRQNGTGRSGDLPAAAGTDLAATTPI